MAFTNNAINTTGIVTASGGTLGTGFLTATGTNAVSAGPVTITKQFFLAAGSNATFPLDTSAGFGYTITSVKQIQTSSGTITAAIQIGGTNVTGLGSISVTSSPQNVTATAANVVSVNNAVTVVFTSNSSATNIQFTLVATRTS